MRIRTSLNHLVVLFVGGAFTPLAALAQSPEPVTSSSDLTPWVQISVGGGFSHQEGGTELAPTRTRASAGIAIDGFRLGASTWLVSLYDSAEQRRRSPGLFEFEGASVSGYQISALAGVEVGWHRRIELFFIALGGHGALGARRLFTIHDSRTIGEEFRAAYALGVHAVFAWAPFANWALGLRIDGEVVAPLADGGPTASIGGLSVVSEWH